MRHSSIRLHDLALSLFSYGGKQSVNLVTFMLCFTLRHKLWNICEEAHKFHGAEYVAGLA
jgi:hypothetical protein